MATASRREKEKRKMRYVSAKERAEKHAKGFEPTALNLPDGAKIFRFKKAGIHRLDILPYRVGKGNPYADEGFDHYERTYYTHRIPTVDGSRPYCCLIKTFGEKRCPICEGLTRERRTGKTDDKTIKDMDWKERQLFNVIDLDAKGEGVQVFEFNWFQFGKVVDAMTKRKEKYENFYSLENGYTIEVEVEENKFEGRTSYKPIAIQFEQRDDYDADIMDKVYCLDDLPKRMDFDELKEIFENGGIGLESANGKPAGKAKAKDDDDEDEEDEDDDETEPDEDEDDDEDEAPAKAKGKKKQDDDDDETEDPTAEDAGLERGDVVMYKGEECEITKISGDGTSLTLKDEDGEIYKAVAPSAVKKVLTAEDAGEDDDEDDEPAPKKKGKAKASDEDEEDDEDETEPDDKDEEEEEEDDDSDDEEDEDEDEEPEPKKARAGKAKRK